MRLLIFLAIVVLILAFAGWISFSKSPGRSSINVETQQIKQDTDRALQSGSNLLRQAGDAVEHPNGPTAPTTSVPTTPSPTPQPAPSSLPPSPATR